MIRTCPAALVLAAVFVGACSSVEPCLPVAPARLPDGSEPGQYSVSLDGAARVAIWRSGDALVVQRILSTSASGEPACPDGELPGPAEDCLEVGGIEVRGQPALLAPVGDDGTTWLLAWSTGGCRYETGFGRIERAEAEAYAAGY